MTHTSATPSEARRPDRRHTNPRADELSQRQQDRKREFNDWIRPYELAQEQQQFNATWPQPLR